MELASTRTVAAPPAEVWRALNDLDVLRASIPGCESLEKTADNAYRAVVTARVGPVAARFTGRMTMTDIDAPNAYTLRFEGQGGAVGFANGEARVTLLPAEAGATSMAYAVKAQIGGKLAQIGSRLIDGAAAKLADDFFARFSVAVGALSTANGSPDAGAQVVEVPATATLPDDAPRRIDESGTWTRFISIAAIVVILAILYFKGGHFRG
ncbi:MAG: carbon monoxide dehydrogenase subunit G [Casimicrobiaceae bacterium]